MPIGLFWLVFVAGDALLRERLGRFAGVHRSPKHVPHCRAGGVLAAQNVLFYYAHARLSATVYLSLSQSKTLFTALFSVPCCSRLSKTQWASQPLLMAGCWCSCRAWLVRNDERRAAAVAARPLV